MPFPLASLRRRRRGLVRIDVAKDDDAWEDVGDDGAPPPLRPPPSPPAPPPPAARANGNVLLAIEDDGDIGGPRAITSRAADASSVPPWPATLMLRPVATMTDSLLADSEVGAPAPAYVEADVAVNRLLSLSLPPPPPLLLLKRLLPLMPRLYSELKLPLLPARVAGPGRAGRSEGVPAAPATPEGGAEPDGDASSPAEVRVEDASDK